MTMKKSFLIIFSFLCVVAMWIYARNIISNSHEVPNYSDNTLSKEFRIMHNQLYVKDLGLMRRFYVDGLWFEIVWQSDDSLELGWDGHTHLVVTQKSDYTERDPRGAGLYHIAYVHPTRSALANRLAQALGRYPDLYEGSADHLVSEAFYMHDPEWNGVELYYDKDPKTWIRTGWRVKMDSLYIDVAQYINTYMSTGNNEFVVWHNHLQVGDLEKARWFYHELLGFDITADEAGRGALFVSAAGYHHHFGLNVWNSNGAGMRPDKELGLGVVTMEIGSTHDIAKLAQRLDAAHYRYEKDNQKLSMQDPWGNRLIFVAR